MSLFQASYFPQILNNKLIRWENDYFHKETSSAILDITSLDLNNDAKNEINYKNNKQKGGSAFLLLEEKKKFYSAWGWIFRSCHEKGKIAVIHGVLSYDMVG